MRLHILGLATLALAIGGCAGLNPNVGTRTADAAYQRGNCASALGIYEPNAQAGQPWAQFRMGMVYYEGKCKPIDLATAISWLRKSAAYESKTDWEKGHEFSTGPAGYFNATTSSANASSILARLYKGGIGVEKDIVTAWLLANYAVSMTAYDVDRPRQVEIRTAIEREMTADERQKAKDLAQTWSPRNAL